MVMLEVVGKDPLEVYADDYKRLKQCFIVLFYLFV